MDNKIFNVNGITKKHLFTAIKLCIENDGHDF